MMLYRRTLEKLKLNWCPNDLSLQINDKRYFASFLLTEKKYKKDITSGAEATDFHVFLTKKWKLSTAGLSYLHHTRQPMTFISLNINRRFSVSLLKLMNWMIFTYTSLIQKPNDLWKENALKLILDLNEK